MTACRGVLVTRPSRQLGRTLAALRAAGHRAEHLPLLQLTPLASPELDAALARYRAADLAIFVSANAVEFGLAALAERNIATAGPRLAAIGAATASALANANVAVDVVPADGHDSESLLAMAALRDVQGRTVLIFRGESEGGGRKTLAATLAARGATVIAATCYRRDPAPHDPARVAAIAAAIETGALNVIQIMSVESLDALLAMLAGTPNLRQCRVIVPHARIGEAARAAGFGDIVVAGLGDEALSHALASPEH
ncbi:MAG: uroporphyrinogen-III synthase [Betaproteobacteria bacterium]|nr:uroporphyrinogen-III synthase [Betaproteobacteria bacterium]